MNIATNEAVDTVITAIELIIDMCDTLWSFLNLAS